jgi:hypothetical protein
VFPVRYELDYYTLFRRDPVFKEQGFVDKISACGSQGARRQDELIGGKSPVAN